MQGLGCRAVLRHFAKSTLLSVARISARLHQNHSKKDMHYGEVSRMLHSNFQCDWIRFEEDIAFVSGQKMAM